MDRARYDRLAILFHWVMAALIFYAAASIMIADDLPRGAFRDLIKTSHNSVGAVVVVLLVLRVLWRIVSTAPAMPS
ncbi:MAG: cytochrome b/b6 domain-containing protein, partial [Roseomonas sp.]|nr:cytochrome b/b6 domain-containing protein [Roseomonas sp.]